MGGDETIKVDIRVIAATHRDLQAMVNSGEFREDLWFRLNVFPITIPPLRARRNDIPALVQHLVQEKSQRLNLHQIPTLTPGAVDHLMAYHWPGNVRELDNVIERALIISDGRSLRFDELIGFGSQPMTSKARTTQSILTLDQVTARHIKDVLAQTDGKVHGPEGAAKLLGINSSTLRYRMDKLGIRYGRDAK